MSENLERGYFEELEKSDIKVVPLVLDNLEKEVVDLDAVIIRENAEKDTAQTCNILLKLQNNVNTQVWVFSTSARSKKMIRSVYLRLGALGIISEDCDEDEFRLIISNNLNQKMQYDKQLKNSGNSEKESEKLVLIPRNHSVKFREKGEIPLTKLEYKAMDLLYRNKNRAVAYRELLEQIWGEKFKDQNYRVANLIFHLRDKIEEDAVNPVLIRTVRSKGYMLVL